MSAASRIPTIGLIVALGISGCGEGSAPTETTARPATQTTNVSFKEFEGYIVHFNALTTDILAPEAARAYSITRSSNQAMLNVHIRRKDGSSFGVPVQGTVTVNAANLTGQLKDLALRAVTDKPTEGSPDKVIYYIGDFSIANGETINFAITIVPEGETQELNVKFSKQFFTK